MKKLFAVELEECCGEAENRYQLLVEADSYEEACKKAHKKALGFRGGYDGDEEETLANIEKEIYCDTYEYDGGQWSMSVYSVFETTKERWMEEQYNFAKALGQD